MKITLNSSELNKKLQFLGTVINSRSTMPILDNFLFEVDNNNLKITASDLETTMSATMNVEFDGKASVAIPAKLLIDILKTFSNQPLGFTIKDNNTIEISSDSGEYEIAYQDGAEFPKDVVLENPTTTIIPAKVLLTAISKTIFATSNDDLRPAMTGVLFQLSPKGLIFVATDAHKLVKYSRTDITASESSDFIVPNKPLGVLKGILVTIDDEVTVQYNKANATFKFESYVVSSRLIDAKYPNYEGVIPKDNPKRFVIERSTFLQSVKRVAVLSNKTTHQIRLKIAGAELNISSEDKDFSNKADERLACDYQGEDIKIGFNSRFLTEMLNNLQSTEIKLEMSEPTRAGILTPVDGLEDGEHHLMLVMPVKID